jgi:hypothetical protein
MFPTSQKFIKKFSLSLFFVSNLETENVTTKAGSMAYNVQGLRRLGGTIEKPVGFRAAQMCLMRRGNGGAMT